MIYDTHTRTHTRYMLFRLEAFARRLLFDFIECCDVRKTNFFQEFPMFGFVIQIRSFPTMKLFHKFKVELMAEAGGGIRIRMLVFNVHSVAFAVELLYDFIWMAYVNVWNVITSVFSTVWSNFNVNTFFHHDDGSVCINLLYTLFALTMNGK